MCFHCPCFGQLKVVEIQELDVKCFLKLVTKSTLACQELYFRNYRPFENSLAVSIQITDLEGLTLSDWARDSQKLRLKMTTRILDTESDEVEQKPSQRVPQWLTSLKDVKKGEIVIPLQQGDSYHRFDGKKEDQYRDRGLDCFQQNKYARFFD